MSAKSRLWITIALAAAYAAFLTMDILGNSQASTRIKYACILLLTLTAVLRALAKDAGASEKITAPALILTAVADWLLLVKASWQTMLPGIAVFLAVQLLYAARLKTTGAYSLRVTLAVRAAAAAAGVLGGIFLTHGSALGILAGLYFSQLLTSAVLETIRPRERCFSLGLWLFVCCDICVGLHNLPSLIPESWWVPVGFGMWLFYLPSQLLIVFSAGNTAKKAEKTEA